MNAETSNDNNDAATDANTATDPSPNAKRKVNVKTASLIIGMIAAVVGSVFFAFKFVEDERARDIQQWQVRIGIVADSRSAAVNQWIEDNFAVMRELSENASLQLYMTELTTPKKASDDPFASDGSAETQFLRNVLTAIADRSGFKPTVEAAEVSANIERVGVAGIGLINAEGKPITSSPGMPPLTPNVRDAVTRALDGQPQVIDIYMGASNLPTIGFVIPVYGVQDDKDSAKGIGAVVGLRVVDDGLFRKLYQPGETAQTAETYLVRPDTNKSGTTIEYLSPLKDGTKALKRALSADTPDLDVAYAIEKPGGFAIKRDYTGDEVLMVSRPIASVPWVLVRKINRAEALAETETRLNTLITVFTLIIVGVTVAIFAVWKHGSSLRATQAAENFRLSSERFQNLSKFMDLIANSQPTGIVAVDGTTTYTYANQPAANEAGIPASDMLGKTMASVIGPVKAQIYADINESVLKNFAANDDRVASREQHISVFGDEDEGTLQVIKSDHIPLRGDRDHPPGVLMILDDITELTHERRRNEKMLRQLIDTLVSVVDRRDPFSSHHSARVAEVSKAIAEEMAADEVTVKTVDISGSLMNLGKIFIPTGLLTKTSDLSDDERKTLMNSYLVSADLLKDVSFEGPVVNTIREMGETIDGSGPLAKSGDDILPTARILAVANAFVGMASARAYRDAMTFEKVSDILLSETGVKFDRRPVSALINFLENRGGKNKWAHYRERPQKDDA